MIGLWVLDRCYKYDTAHLLEQLSSLLIKQTGESSIFSKFPVFLCSLMVVFISTLDL